MNINTCTVTKGDIEVDFIAVTGSRMWVVLNAPKVPMCVYHNHWMSPTRAHVLLLEN